MKNINKNEKILIISPHPDDDVLGCGGIMAKHGPQCDVMCINSSGFQEPYEQCADTRIKEFHNVMDFYNVHKRWIWKIFGPAPNIDQIRANESEYLNTTDFSQYSRIFIPCRYDEHVEHAFIANNLVPKMLTRASHKCLIYEYMIWGKVKVKPNCSFI